MKPMNSREREALLKEMQKTIDWYKGIKHEKPRKDK